VNAGEIRRAGAGVIAGTIAQRGAVLVRQPGEDESVFAEGLERLEDA
jgi:hypothetical protein